MLAPPFPWPVRRREFVLNNEDPMKTSIRRWLRTIVLLTSVLRFAGTSWAQSGADDEDATLPGDGSIVSGIESNVSARYVFRGVAYSPGPVSQYTAWIEVAGFTFYGWGNLLLQQDPRQQSLSEIDFGASYVFDVGRLTLEPGFDGYVYRLASPLSSPPTAETSIRVSGAIGPVDVFTKQILDIGSLRGAYFGEAGLETERAVDRGRKAVMSGSMTLGWASRRFNEAYIGIAKQGLDYVGLGIALTYSPNARFYLKSHLMLTRVVDPQLRLHVSSPDVANFGISVGLSLN
jgi:hypothetical protein